MKLSDLQYSVLIQALHNARDSHLDGNFIDPFGENAGKHTQEDVEQAINEVETIVMQSWESVEPVDDFDYDDSTDEELLAHVARLEDKGAMSICFTRGDYYYDIDEHSEGGYYYSRYESAQAFNRGDDDIAGGLCTTTLTNAVEMAIN